MAILGPPRSLAREPKDKISESQRGKRFPRRCRYFAKSRSICASRSGGGGLRLLPSLPLFWIFWSDPVICPDRSRPKVAGPRALSGKLRLCRSCQTSWVYVVGKRPLIKNECHARTCAIASPNQRSQVATSDSAYMIHDGKKLLEMRSSRSKSEDLPQKSSWRSPQLDRR